ncbi:disease resistance protein RUN1-like isoform X1 [Syzygium oleosum]|uniref:disease resistance protein RUN1-like isoform X1 n=1 Tax=Syzygium oleosum TaxID=219896 RepID=UPI0024B930B0|nr:disease resistance protein RUN1-like isoform X1 [Syzygium oleosum]
MASSSKPKKIYDVFLSFRGADVRKNFLGHLYKALDQNGIYTFRDSEELRKGDHISAALMKAIEESCIAVIIFSEDYASSWWCLEEVAKIMECKEQKNLTVLPVFYKVDPREVRGGRKSYRRALAKHESKFGKDSEKVKRWKKALFDVGNLSGWHLTDGDESELIQSIVKKISIHLNRTHLQVAKHPVGIESQVVKLKSMFNLDSDDDVVMVGLWGPGGIGKTTLAKALYNTMFRQFEGSCFLADVRETSKGFRGLVTLQEMFLNDILLPQQRLEVSNVDEGINIIQHRLGRKKVLLLIDDVDDLRQLDALVGEGNWFGNGSRIIVTTRDRQLLTCHGIDQDHVYEVKPLGYSEAHELLRNHASPRHKKLEIRTHLVKSVLNHAKGLPLALVVLGSLLYGTTEDIWESTLKKLSRIPDKTINDVLKISYDGLDENEKEIFLHIACFFKGRAREYTKKVLDSCDLHTTVGLDILIKRSLISIEYGGLKMHDLIQAMGIDIVNQECRDDPGRRSRLWQYDDVLDVLSRDIGDCAVKAIVLEPPELKQICIGGDAFTKMRRLRLLIVRNVSFQGPMCLPNELRWFGSHGCTSWIPEFSSDPKKLVGFDMHESSITVVPKQLKEFQQLKYINFSYCKSLISMPDLSCTPNLEELDLGGCKSLVEAHESIAYHDKLQVLNLRNCSELSVFPNMLKSKNLRALHLQKCTKFERFPDIPHKLEGLKELWLEGTAIKELPQSIENLVSLKKMDLCSCKNLISLPSSIYGLQNLEELVLFDCTNLFRFPKYEDSADPMKTGLSSLRWLNLVGCNLFEVEFLENLSCFPSLEALILAWNNITSLPTSINKRDRLSLLHVESCHKLQEIPELPPLLNCLLADGCESLQKIGDLTSFHNFVHRGLSMANISPLENPRRYMICLPRGEMPEWVLPIDEDSVFFQASKDLYDKLLGFALCAILSNDEQGNDAQERFEFRIEPRVNGKRQDYDLPYQDPLYTDSNRIWLEYFIPSKLWGVVDFGKSDGSWVQFSLRVSGGLVKKWGFRIICKQLNDNLKIMLQDNQLMDPAFLYEIGYDSIDLESESSLIHENNSSEADPQEDLQDCQMSIEEHSQIALKRNHELFSLEECDPRPCGLLIRLAETSMAVFARCFCC